MLSERISRNVERRTAPLAKGRGPVAPAMSPCTRDLVSLRNSAGIERMTRVPEPTVISRRPSAVSCSKAAVVVLRETTSSSASSRVDGSKAPGASRPVRIASRIASATCRCRLRRPRRCSAITPRSSAAERRRERERRELGRSQPSLVTDAFSTSGYRLTQMLLRTSDRPMLRIACHSRRNYSIQ